MTKIIDYVTMISDSLEDLDTVVNNFIKEGWQPFGGVAISLSETDNSRYAEYAQAMVKYEVDTRYDEWLAYHSSPRIFNLTDKVIQ